MQCALCECFIHRSKCSDLTTAQYDWLNRTEAKIRWFCDECHSHIDQDLKSFNRKFIEDKKASGAKKRRLHEAVMSHMPLEFNDNDPDRSVGKKSKRNGNPGTTARDDTEATTMEIIRQPNYQQDVAKQSTRPKPILKNTSQGIVLAEEDGAFNNGTHGEGSKRSKGSKRHHHRPSALLSDTDVAGTSGTTNNKKPIDVDMDGQSPRTDKNVLLTEQAPSRWILDPKRQPSGANNTVSEGLQFTN